MTDREKVLLGLTCCGNLVEWSEKNCRVCPYKDTETGQHGCEDHLVADALAIIKSLQEDIEVWKKRYRWVAIERKTANDPNKEPNIVKVYTTEETEKGGGVGWLTARK